MSSEVAHISWPLICLSGCISMGTTYLIVGVVVSHGLLRVRFKQVAYLINGFHIPLLLLLMVGSGP